MSVQPRIRALVIDDSVYSRRALARVLESSPLIEVVGTCADGEEALARCLALRPDLVTLDLEMPRMDGFTFLRLLMARQPTPVIVVSSRSGHSDVFTALELGAVDFVAKPRPGAEGPGGIEQELLRKVHAVLELRLDRLRERLAAAPPRVAAPSAADAPRVVVLGASTGGPTALLRLLGAFEERPPMAFAVAQHMPPGFTHAFAERIDRLTALTASEAVGGESLAPGHVLVAPGGRHLELEAAAGGVRARVDAAGPGERYAPSVDRLFASAAKHCGPGLVAVVLTGMGSDGREGARAVRAAGGFVIAESQETAVIFGMPRQVIQDGLADAACALDGIPQALWEVGSRDQEERTP